MFVNLHITKMRHNIEFLFVNNVYIEEGSNHADLHGDEYEGLICKNANTDHLTCYSFAIFIFFSV